MTKTYTINHLGLNWLETPDFNTDPLKKYERSNNERLLPTGKELADKNFSVSVWCYIQTHSVYNPQDGYRYISERDLSITRIVENTNNLAKNPSETTYFEKHFDRSTIREKIKHLKENGYLLDIVDGEKIGENFQGNYYRVLNNFNHYILIERDFLECLHYKLSQDALKLYFLYYSFVQDDKDSKCYLNQDEILKRIGLSKSGANLYKLRFLNRQLEELGLIRVYFREKNVAIVHNYWDSQYYLDFKQGKIVFYTVTYVEV